MAITGANIRTALNSRLGKAEVADAINDQITEGLHALGGLAQWPDLHTSSNLSFVAADKSKAVPSDFRTENELYISGYAPLVFASYDAIREAQESAGGSSRPRWYAIHEGSVHVYPIPDASYTVVCKYYRFHTTVSDETDNLLFGDQFKEAIVLATIVEYLKTVGKMSQTHPKMVQSVGLFNKAAAALLPTADRKVTVAKPHLYGG